MTSASSFLGGGSFRPKGPPVEIVSGAGTFVPVVPGWYRYTATGAGGGGGAGDTVNGGGGGGAAATWRGILKITSAGIAYVIPTGGSPGVNGGSLILGRIHVPGGRAGQSRSGGGRGGNGGGPAALPSVNPLDTTSSTYVPDGVMPGGAGGDSFVVTSATGSPAMPPGYPLSGVTSSQTGLTITGAADTQGGAGGSSEFGDGGAIAANDAVGNNATGYGAGGGGGGKAASGTRAGGTGSGGRLYLEPLGEW